MAKKAKAEETVEVAPRPTVAKKETVKKPQKPEWEYRDRLYTLKGNKKPLTYVIPSKHSSKNQLLWFDEETRTQRTLRYATNQVSPFIDEQRGMCTLGRIVF
jgi:hypothetical protein